METRAGHWRGGPRHSLRPVSVRRPGKGRRATNDDVFAVAQPYEEGGAAERTIGLLVDDVDAAAAELRVAGVETDGISENARWRYTHFRAPDGKLYELVEKRSG